MNQNAIAKELGVSRQTLLAWKKDEGLVISAKNLPALRKRAAKKGERDSTNSEIQKARLRKMEVESEMKEHALDVERGKFILRSEVEAAGRAAGFKSRAAWEKIVSDLPPILEGQTALQMAATLRKYARERCEELSEIFK